MSPRDALRNAVAAASSVERRLVRAAEEMAAHGAGRLLIGTHAPFLTPAAARHKLMAAKLTPAEFEAVSRHNAERLGLRQSIR